MPALTKLPAPDRTDHIWFRDGKQWKCCLCGGITKERPRYPTPKDFEVERYETLTDEERARSPNPNPVGKT